MYKPDIGTAILQYYSDPIVANEALGAFSLDLFLAALPAKSPGTTMVRRGDIFNPRVLRSPLEKAIQESLDRAAAIQRASKVRYGITADVFGMANRPPLRMMHPESSLRPSSLDFWRKQSTDDIVKSLSSGAKEPLIVDESGLIWQGNHRIKVLRERGFNVNDLPRVPKLKNE
jgi:hypothetical protein